MDLISELSPRQKVDLFQARLKELAQEANLIPWDPDPVKWIQEHFWIPETKGPIQLYPHQIAALREAVRKDADGKFVYTTVVWSDIKKSAKCLGRTTEVVLATGAKVKAEDIRAGNSVLAYDEDNGTFINKLVLGVEEQPPEPAYKITTKRGREIVVSAEHPFLVLGHRPPSLHRVDKNWQDYPKWVAARDITSGHRLAVALDFLPDLPATSAELRNAYMLGAFAGDGSAYSMTSADAEVIAPFSEVFDVAYKGKYHYALRGSGEWLRENGFTVKPERGYQKHCNAYTKKTPPKALSGGRQAAAHYLAGLFDTDGTISDPKKARRPNVTWGLVNKGLLLDAQHLLAGLGINASLYPSKAKCNGKTFDIWKLSVNGREQVARFAELIPTRLPRKREKLLGWGSKGRVLDKSRSEYSIHEGDVVEKVEVLAPETTIAIEVEDLHTHITNGLITHNSTIAAAVALWRAWNIPWGSIYIIANDLKQADSRVAYYMRRAVELNPQMRRIVAQRNYRTTLPNQTFIESVPIDPTGEAGSNADGVVFSELWGAHSEAQRRMWTESTIPPNKFGYAQRWVETYAGFTGESQLLEQLYHMGHTEGRRLVLPGCPDLEIFANDNAKLLVLWNTRPRLPWQTPEYYTQEAAILPPSQFLRVHRNQWVRSTEAFVPIEWWDACKTDPLPPLNPRRTMVFAVDAGVSSDCFAVVGVERVKGKAKDKSEDKIILRYCNAWHPPKGGKLDFELPEKEIKRLAKKYRVMEWAYDEYQLHDMGTRMRKQKVGWWNPFSQTGDRNKADKQLFDMIREGRILHDGNALIREHLQNANAEVKGEKMRLVKREELAKIDCVVALSMAVYEAMRLNL